ncbi:MAG: cell division protein FtsZ [Candidatus Heimdallarchaeota archaeon]|nr:cell division protein FtsZ [Candidatus Heimdallarchaeota archaeon]
MDGSGFPNNPRDRDQNALEAFVTNSRDQQRPLQQPSRKPLGKTNCYVVGVGGGGNNTINRLKATGLRNAFCICINTDLQHLNSVKCDSSLLIGRKTTRGLGCGGNPEKGRVAAEESYGEIERLLSDADIIFLTCGLGGGTGTGSIPLVAEIAKNSGAIVIGVVTIPFTIEGARKQRAYMGLDALSQNADTVVVIENDRLLELVPDSPIEEAFSVADEVLANYIYSIISTVSQPGLINVDFADLTTIITNSGGVTVCGLGEATGEDRAVKAVKDALENPLVSVNYRTGSAALIHVTGGSTMSLKEASGVVEIIKKELSPGAEVIWGTKVDPELGDLLRLTVVISGVESDQIIGQRTSLKRGYHSSYQEMLREGRSSAEPISRAKENWLRRDFVPIFKELQQRKNTSPAISKTVSKKSSQSKKDNIDDFWRELGLSKGLK